jgi:hypothetical protein
MMIKSETKGGSLASFAGHSRKRVLPSTAAGMGMRQETMSVQDHGSDMARGTQLCVAGEEPPTEQEL